MSLDLERLKDIYALSEDRSNHILKQVIKKLTYRKQSVGKPKAVIIGGQPGAVKTELQKVAEMELVKNAVICNVDNLREFHPMADEIKRYHEDNFAAITSDIAHHWNRELCRYCRRNNLNYIQETPFKSGQGLNETMKAMKDSGFGVDVKLLAVNPRLSRLGIKLRYEQMMHTFGKARNVSTQAHDLLFVAIPFAVRRVQEVHLYDEINVYARSVILEGSRLTRGVTLVAHNPTSPYGVFQAEVNRPWPPKLEKYFNESCRRVLDYMERRKAPRHEVDDFKRDLGVGEFNKVRKKRTTISM